MEKFKDFHKSGLFKLSSGKELHGELVLNGGASSLNLYSDSFFSTRDSRDILGTFHDRVKVSLIRCVTTSGPGSGYRGDEEYHFSTVFPHFAIIGDEHVTSTDRKIALVTFVVDDAPTIFYDFEAFGSVLEPRPHMERIATSQQKSDRAIEVGDHPHIFYFTGKRKIFEVPTAIGTVSVSHCPAYSFPSPRGINVKNTIRIEIAFAAELVMDEALRAVQDALRFFDVIAGRPQNVSELAFALTQADAEHPRYLQVYWSLRPQRGKDDESRSPQPADLPLNAGISPDPFAALLARWLQRQDEWRTARARFATAAAHQNRYSTDRLIGAANMFDIMPTSACPADVPLTTDLEKARADARQAFKALAPSAEQESVLSALGRIGKATLKHKIRKRVELVTRAAGGKFPDLALVTDQAVVCRNFYVHGSPGRFDYGIHSDQTTFFTDTLEFVFAASDLIEAGWDMAEWMKQGTSMSHPFGRYLVSYREWLDRLKKLLPGT